MLPGLRGWPGDGGVGSVRRGVGCTHADRGRELHHAQEPPDQRHDGVARRTRARGSTCSTGTERAPPRGCSRPGGGIARARRRGGAPVSAKHPRPAWAPDELTATWQSASLLLGYPDERLRAHLPVVRDAAARLPEQAGRSAARGRGPPRAERAGGPAGGLRRDLRHPPPMQPLPDLLRARRHPQARGGAAAVQADLPALGFVLDAQPDSGQSCPTTCASCSSTPPRSTRRSGGSCCWTTGPGSSCCGSPCSSRRARGRAPSTAVSGDVPAVAR